LLGTPLDEDGNPLPEEAFERPVESGSGAAAGVATPLVFSGDVAGPGVAGRAAA
jgi:hypothetical protein